MKIKNIKISNNHSIKNNIDFINKLKSIKLRSNYKIASFDIVDLYTNVPVQETLTILKANLINAKICNSEEINDLVNLLEVVLYQNYFTFNNNYYIQKKSLAMGSPLSGLLADIYLNHYENMYLLNNVNKLSGKIISYTRYVDDTFIIFNGTLR